MDVDRLVYGSVPLDLFVFEMNEGGRAISVEVPALQLKLARI